MEGGTKKKRRIDGRRKRSEGGMCEEGMQEGTAPAEISARMAEVSGRE